MSESLIPRVRRLISGSLNAVIDTIEGNAPDTVMREAIREVERATDEVRHELGVAIASRHHASKRLMEATTKHDELADQARFAIDQGRDDLAAAAVSRQLDMEAQIPVLEGALKDIAQKQTELEGFVTALLARKREMEADLASFVETRNQCHTEAKSGPGPAPKTGPDAAGAANTKADRAGRAFHRVLEAKSGVGSTPPADQLTSQKLHELDRLARDHRIEERLAALKAKADLA
ncbi:MAG: PspA/IM30 family protein [Pseudomonadota bacterium]